MTIMREIKPADGLIVRHPTAPYAPLKVGGETVEFTSYWRRKLNSGDVIEIKASEKGAPK